MGHKRIVPYIAAVMSAALASGALAVDRTTVSLDVIWFDYEAYSGGGYVYATMSLQLFDELAPKTVINFKKYIESGEYQYSIIHRSAQFEDGSPFVIQGGGFWLSQDPDETVTVQNLANYGPIVNEFKVGQMSNTRGTIAMARTNNLNSATSQWFINLSDNTFLDNPSNPYTVFGQVTEGMDVADWVGSLPTFDFRYGTDPAHSAFQELPVVNYGQNEYWAGYPLTFENFLFVDMQILSEPLLGDLDRSGLVNALDISPFVTALTQATTLPYQPQADVNEDGLINSLDIPAFVQALTHQQGTSAATPEPGSAAALLALLALLRRHR